MPRRGEDRDRAVPARLRRRQIYRTPSGAVDGTPIRLAGGPCNPFVPAAICNCRHRHQRRRSQGHRLPQAPDRISARVTSTANRHFFRIVAGFEGKLFNDRWSWDLSYNFGRTEEQPDLRTARSTSELPQRPGRRSESPSQATSNGNGTIRRYRLRRSDRAGGRLRPDQPLRRQQHHAGGGQFIAAETQSHVQGYAAGVGREPVRLALRPSRRVRSASRSAPSIARKQSEENWDALTNAGRNLGNALPDTKGEFNVKEAYAEVNVPILKDCRSPISSTCAPRAVCRIIRRSARTTTWNVGGD